MGRVLGRVGGGANRDVALWGRCTVSVVLLALMVLVGACGAADDTSESASSTESPTDTGSAAGYDATTTSLGAPSSTAPTSGSDATSETTITGGAQVTANPTVLIKTSLGDITAELDAAAAPLTVENFLSYVEDGHYDGTIFHRVIPGFMIQGGGFTPDMEQKSTKAPIKNEADNGLKNMRGTLAMARTGVVDSATSQFFINVVDNQFLDYAGPSPQTYGYAVFGRVTSGMDVVDAIVAVPTATVGSFQNVPQSPVVIESISVVQ